MIPVTEVGSMKEYLSVYEITYAGGICSLLAKDIRID
jgi:hypothetical protein